MCKKGTANGKFTPLYIKRIVTYWVAFAVGYVFPLLYFIITAGIQKEVTRFVLPTLIVGIILVAKLLVDIPKWTKTWKPSVWKGLLQGLPQILLFIILVTLGLVLKGIAEKQIEIAFRTYFETVGVVFGSQAVSAVVNAFHIKYKQLDLLEKGYVMGTINEK